MLPVNPGTCAVRPVAADGNLSFLEWAYQDPKVPVRDGAESYVIEDGKIVAQTIHYTVQPR